MIRARRSGRVSDETGFALIEVIVSALVIVLVSAAVFELLGSTGRASAEQRHRSQAYAIAQEDQARLRSMQISSLQRELPPRTVTLNGTPYVVTSSATFVSEGTGATSCSSTAKADYIKVASQVTWPSMRAGSEPVSIESIDSPVSGSVDPTSGSLAVLVTSPPAELGKEAMPISGVALTGSGPSTFSGSTDSNGCALFGRQPAGNYVVTPKLAPEYVDQDGKAPSAVKAGIIGGSTNTLSLQYGRAGTIEVSFKVKTRSGSEVAANADSIVVRQPEMSGPKVFGTPGGAPSSLIEAERLFPFTSTYNIFTGSCATSNLIEAGSANVKVTAGGTAAATVLMPALYVIVSNGGTSFPLAGARVTLTDPNCLSVKRVYTTDGNGELTEPGVPRGAYELCASAKIGSVFYRLDVPKVEVASTEGNNPPLSINLAKGLPGKCP